MEPPRPPRMYSPELDEPDFVSEPAGWKHWVGEHLFAVPEDVDMIDIGGRALVWVLLLYFTASHLTMDIETGEINNTFLHRVNLVFHEAGHIIFMILGDFMATLGGSLMQILMPAICFAVFVVKYRNAFGGAVTLWWVGQSAVDLAPYIYDARAQEMMLLGGVTGRDVPGYHDWNNLLSRLDLLMQDHAIGMTAWTMGAVGMIGALVWGATLLWLQWRHVKENPSVV